ncbi:hypothetical protein FLONG3_3614 [Fusarium longipes]|uniref:Uncharacterized protein n=1 Tax=Fusarium longipes TaxID=694270 RepID=A0A395T1M9_9HYPO|nr:hypothetical protein FLONG3_3614 [Fusarium longipes]
MDYQIIRMNREMDYQDLPLLEEVGSLNPRFDSPPPPKKTAAIEKVEIIDDDTIPDAHLIRDSPPAPAKRVRRRRSGCWRCKMKKNTKKTTKKPDSDKPKSKADGINDPAARDFILAAEKRLKQIENGELIEEEPKTDPKAQDTLDVSTITGMTPEEVDEFMKRNPFGIIRDTKEWFANW